ncbi:hypothetical protein H8E88_05080 [candidate division KSB1 bacterium]|nr:hypothetical protein [candidate division KSB1 bacterium]
MPIYQKPTSDIARLAFLQETKVTAEADIAAGNPSISQATLDAIILFLPDFEDKIDAISATLTGREKEVRERNYIFDKLETYLRDFWAVLVRRVHRNKEHAEVFTYYKLPLSGVMPSYLTKSQMLEIAKDVVLGDANAVVAGHTLMSNPSALELDAVIQAAKVEFDDVAIADRDYDQAQAIVADSRIIADEFIQEVMDELRFALRKMDFSSQRRVMRSYGAIYEFVEGEPEDDLEIE